MGGQIDEKTRVPISWVAAITLVLMSAAISYGILYEKVDNLAVDMSDVKSELAQLVGKDKVAAK